MDDQRKDSLGTERQSEGKGKEASIYRPITCLPIAWEILTGIPTYSKLEFFDAALNRGRRLFEGSAYLKTKGFRQKFLNQTKN